MTVLVDVATAKKKGKLCYSWRRGRHGHNVRGFSFLRRLRVRGMSFRVDSCGGSGFIRNMVIW